MNCLEFRRLLLVHPRVLTPEQESHAAECVQCARAAAEAAALDMKRAQTVFVPVPDALADRLVLGVKAGRPVRYGVWAMAAALLLGVVLGAQLYRTYETTTAEVAQAAALPRDHPAVAAISFVLDHEPRLLAENRSGDMGVMRASFRRLGLKEPPAGTMIRYLGKCPVPGGTGDHVVLTTAQGQVTLILVPDYPLGARVMVADRNMTALANPSGSGGYIVIAHSAQTVRQIEQMLSS
jgi:hypothetical protein